jgi:hypothetical protein
MISEKDGEAVAEFIRTRGITRCPTACVSPTQALVGAADRAELQAHGVSRDRVRQARAGIIFGKCQRPNREIGSSQVDRCGRKQPLRPD